MGLSSPNSTKLEGVLKFQSSHFYLKKSYSPCKAKNELPKARQFVVDGGLELNSTPFHHYKYVIFKCGIIELNHFFQNAPIN